MQPRVHGPNDKRVDASSTRRPECSHSIECAPHVWGFAERHKTRRSQSHLLASDAQREVAALAGRQDQVGKALMEIERILFRRRRTCYRSNYFAVDEFDEGSEMGPEVGVRNKEDSVVAMPVVHWSCEAELRITNVLKALSQLASECQKPGTSVADRNPLDRVEEIRPLRGIAQDRPVLIVQLGSVRGS